VDSNKDDLEVATPSCSLSIVTPVLSAILIIVHTLSRLTIQLDFLGGDMKCLLAIVLCLAIPLVTWGGENSYKITYDGGSLNDIKAGDGAKLFIEPNQIRIARDKKDVVAIPASAITEISYGQDVHRRVGAAIGLAVVSLGIGALMALTKSKKHYVGITWADGDKKGGFAMQCDKNDYRGVLAGLEGVSGKKAVDSDTMTVKN